MRTLAIFILCCLGLIILFPAKGITQSLGINTDGSAPDASSILDVKSSIKGMLVPRTSSTTRLAIVNPAKGLMLYDTTTASFWFFNALAWKEITTAGNDWGLTGNSGTDTSIHFLGTTDATDLLFRIDNIRRLRLTQNGSLNLMGDNENMIIGDSAGTSNTGAANHFIGYQAGYLNTTGYQNYFSGYKAGFTNTTGYNNHFEGLAAGYLNTIGNSNHFSGVNAGYSNTTGNNNQFIGFQSGYQNTGGSFNQFNGLQSGLSNTTGSYNHFDGYQAGYSNTTADFNTAIGAFPLYNNTSGTSNTAVGHASMVLNQTGSFNTAVGRNSLFSNTGNNNTAVGCASLASNTIGKYNVAVGDSTLYFQTGNSTYNTAVGTHALYSNGTGTGNVTTGAYASYKNTSGSYNVAIGFTALNANTTGDYSTAIGASALSYQSFNNGGIAWISGNVAVGYAALLVNNPTSISNGINNTAVGYSALYLNSTGYSNTASGYAALYSNTTGFNNTAFGQGALYYVNIGQGNTAVGYGAGNAPGSPGVNNTVSIGNNGYLNGASNQAFIGNLSTAWIGGQTTWFTFASDKRVKDNIQEDVKGLDFILRLKPVTYHLNIRAMAKITGNKETADYPEKYDVEKIKQSGFLAQQVEQAAHESGYDFSGVKSPKNDSSLYSVSYEQFVVPLVKATQEQQTMIEELKKQLAGLKKELEALKHKK